jgi:hypothetical protein
LFFIVEEKLKRAKIERKNIMKQSLSDVKLEIEKLLFKYQQSNDFERFRNMDVLDEG